MSSRRRGRPLTSGLRQLYPGVKARASSGWGRFRVSVLQMAVPTGGSVPARPPRRLLAVRPADGYFSWAAVRQPDRMADGGGCPYGRPPLRSPGGPPRPSTARMASSLIPAPGSPPPPPPTVLSTVEFQVSIRRAAQTPSICFRTYVSQEL